MLSLHEIYKDVESRTLELEDQVKRLKQLFKPWPPPRQCEEEVPALEHKVEVSESPATEVIPVDEQAELDKINKLLNKAQGARNAHKKMVRKIQEDDSTVRVQNDKSPEVHIDNQEKRENMENGVRKPCASEMDAQPLSTVSRDITHQKVVTQKENIHELNVKQKKNASTNSFVTKPRNIAQNSNTVSKPSIQGPKPSVSGRTLSAQNKRPGSGTGKKKVVPAHISAPFQTNPNLKTSKLQSTYRSATASKPSLRAQANMSSAKVRTGGVNRSVKGSHSASTKIEQEKFSHEKSDISVRSTSHDSKAHCDNDGEAVSVADVKSKQNNLNFRELAEKDQLNLNANCDDKISNSRLHETGQSTAVIDKISGGRNDAEPPNLEDETEKLFHLMRDGSSIDIPVKLKKYFYQNTKLRRQYQTQALTRKVNSPSASQNFSCLLEQTEKFDDSTAVQTLAKQAEDITNTYRHLSTLLGTLHLDHISDQSTPAELLHSKKNLEFLLTEFQENEELFLKTDFRPLKTIPVGTRLSRLKMKRPSRSPSIWYSKFSSLPGHRLAECVVYKGSKDLERYRSLVFQTQLMSCQIELMDSSAQLVLPVLKSLDPASSDFLPVLRSAYELLSLKSNTSPVVVRDTIEEDS